MTKGPPSRRIPFRIHPRVFNALGEDLVTNDVVAALELVKNSYDAFATGVDVIFRKNDRLGPHLDIIDNGIGMDQKTIEDAWCVVATPYRKRNPTVSKGKRTRRVSGEKGLGRLSAARLGSKLRMLTKSASHPALLVKVNWLSLSSEESLDQCYVTCRPFTGKLPFEDTGTRVRILGLHSPWQPDQIAELEENLARLVSPFSKVDDFSIRLTAPEADDHESRPIEIAAPEFLSHPPYAIRGHVTAKGEVKARYEFNPISQGKPRQLPVSMKWSEILANSDLAGKLREDPPECGRFEFEIRAWDIGSEDTQEVADHYEIAKGNVRKAIRAHKGISVYRDGILVLPKSEENRDWLGLDLRRISKVGTRLSTSQIVGYVSITADENRLIEDTSDREGLARNSAVLVFQEILKAIVSVLESQRNEDRLKPGDEIKLQALLDGVSGEELVDEVSSIAEEGGSAQEALLRVKDFSAKLAVVRDAIKTRFIYYSRLATVGTIAQMLVHEIRNRTTAIARFLRLAAKVKTTDQEDTFQKQRALAEASVQSLEGLADTFAPLASRSFRRGRRDSVVEESIARCVSMLDADIRKGDVALDLPATTHTEVSVDPGELDTIILNLLTNALYWLSRGQSKQELEITVRRNQNGDRARVTVSDSGQGVADTDAQRIFLPGVTRKPGGIGMGLTVAAELVSEYGGRISLQQPGRLGGATFSFDLPLKA